MAEKLVAPYRFCFSSFCLYKFTKQWNDDYHRIASVLAYFHEKLSSYYYRYSCWNLGTEFLFGLVMTNGLNAQPNPLNQALAIPSQQIGATFTMMETLLLN